MLYPVITVMRTQNKEYVMEILFLLIFIVIMYDYFSSKNNNFLRSSQTRNALTYEYK